MIIITSALLQVLGRTQTLFCDYLLHNAAHYDGITEKTVTFIFYNNHHKMWL